MLSVRNMLESDTEDVAAIHLASWQKAYQHLLPSPYLSKLDLAKLRDNWRVGLEINPDVVRLVALQNKQVVGYSVGLENRFTGLFPEVPAELWAVYVHPDNWQQDIGSRLLRAFSEQISARNWSQFIVWVLEENHSARKFYEKNGGLIQPQQRISLYGGEEFNEVSYLFKTI